MSEPVSTPPIVGARPMPELTTVADDEVVVFDGERLRTWEGLEPDAEYVFDGLAVRTLPRPGGARLATFATVNDVHFGETECGHLAGFEVGPVFTVGPDDEPYPEVMNRAAAAEIAALDPDAVVVKGDLTTSGRPEEYAAFRACYEPLFGDRLWVVRGNHESYNGAAFAAMPTQEVELPGVRLAILDTSRDGRPNGDLDDDQLEWLDELAARSDRPVMVLGHHHAWSPHSRQRPEGYFGIVPDASERLVEVAARRPAIVGYFAGHTHRNRVRRFAATGDVPWVEVASVKDFPGAWAEYRVFEGGIVQVFRRIGAPEALTWSEKTTAMFAGTYYQYAFGTLDDRCFVFGGR